MPRGTLAARRLLVPLILLALPAGLHAEPAKADGGVSKEEALKLAGEDARAWWEKHKGDPEFQPK